jgi:heat-inducible transcriptional repressor
MADLSARARQILYACVTEFVANGEPVGSRTLSKKHGIDLSPASIRNVLSDLEEWGYLSQPHTSAGRIPTDRAFRLFIDALMRMQDLSPEDVAQIRVRFESLVPSNLMRESGRLLSELTGTVAVVITPRAESLTLKHLRFVRIHQGELLAVLVLSDGSVQNRFVRGDVGEPDLLRVHNLLDDVIEGRTLGELRDLFARRLATEQVQNDDLRRRAFSLGGAAVGEALEHGGADVVIEGQAKLLGQPEFAGAQGMEGMKQVMNALDEREQLLRLLDATVAAKGTTVVVGHEAGELGGGQLSIIGAAYKDHGRAAGSIGVIGPTRMDYPKVMPLVSATASAMTAFITKRSEKREESDE